MFKAINTENLISTYLVPWGINLGLALLIFFVGRLVSKVLVKVIKNILNKSNLNPILIDFIGSIANAILLLVVIIASLNQPGVDTTSLIALIGAAGLAIGLSLQGSLQILLRELCLLHSDHLR